MKPKDKKNQLTLLEILVINKIKYGMFECECGNKKRILLNNVIRERTKSCGCYKSKVTSQRNKDTAKHRYTNTHLYNYWSHIKQYCNKNCKRYKGHSIDQSWIDFNIFLKWSLENGYKENYVLIFTNDQKLYGPNSAKYVDSKSSFKIKQSGTRPGTDKSKWVTNDPLYNSWIRMKRKCYSKTSDRYQENIEVCDEWKTDFCEFKRWSINNGYNKNNLLSRKDESKNFTPENTIWINRIENSKKYVVKQMDSKHKKYGSKIMFGQSKVENRVRLWIENLSGYDFKSNYTILDGKEIDLYNNQLKLGIEYCGLFWHCEDSIQPRLHDYHYNKYKKCLDKDIRLITIFADEWMKRNKQVKNFLKSVLNIHYEKVYARKTKIIELDVDTAIEFINQNHIQPLQPKQKIYLGLEYQNKLISVMSFGNHHRGNEGLVLSRFCCLDGYQIVGGASKLLKRGIQYGQDNGYNKIISWSDNRWSLGNLYEKLGFIMETELKPDYSYVKLSSPNSRIPKQSMTKKIMECPEGITEKECANNLGYTRIWDCGKKRWILNI